MFVAAYRNTERSIALRNSVPGAVASLHARLKMEHERAKPIPKPVPVVVELPKPVGLIPRSRFQKIERLACRVFKVTRADLRSQRRNGHLVLARHFVYYWTTRRTTYSLPQIGRLVGGRDHTTILHGKRAYVEKRARMGRTLRSL